MFNIVKRAGNAVASKFKRVVAALTVALFSLPAFAASGSFDSASIVTKIQANAAEAVLIIGAFILAVWGLRAMGLLGRRG